jgi:hypothetical protein
MGREKVVVCPLDYKLQGHSVAMWSLKPPSNDHCSPFYSYCVYRRNNGCQHSGKENQEPDDDMNDPKSFSSCVILVLLVAAPPLAETKPLFLFQDGRAQHDPGLGTHSCLRIFFVDGWIAPLKRNIGKISQRHEWDT